MDTGQTCGLVVPIHTGRHRAHLPFTYASRALPEGPEQQPVPYRIKGLGKGPVWQLERILWPQLLKNGALVSLANLPKLLDAEGAFRTHQL